MAKVTDLVAQLAQPLAEAAGCSLWDVEYVKEAGTWYLRIYIDKETGVSIDDCEAVSRPLSDALGDGGKKLLAVQLGAVDLFRYSLSHGNSS